MPAHAVRDPNGRAYNRTALPERCRMMQAWADYLDRLRAGEEIEPGTQGPGLTYTPGSGAPTPCSPFPVAEAALPTVGATSSAAPRSVAVAQTHRLDGRRTGDPPPDSGVEHPSRRDPWTGATPPARVAGACTCRPSPMPIKACRKGGSLPSTAACPGAAAALRRPWYNCKTASHIRKRWRAHRNDVSVHMYPIV